MLLRCFIVAPSMFLVGGDSYIVGHFVKTLVATHFGDTEINNMFKDKDMTEHVVNTYHNHLLSSSSSLPSSFIVVLLC